MKKSPTTITVGIPAYNEEANLANAINSILNQRQGNYRLDQILVISDGSSDNTCQVARAVKSKKILVVERGDRRGKAVRLNEIFTRSSTDLLLLLDADTVLSENFISTVCEYYADQNPKIGIITGTVAPITTNFFSKIIASGHRVARRISRAWKHGQNVLAVHGACLVVTKSLYKSIRLPATIGTDAFLYFSALQNKLAIKYLDTISAYYVAPTNLADHFKQSSRFMRSQLRMTELFGIEAIKEYRYPLRLVLSSTLSELKNSGIFLIGYLITHALALIYANISANSPKALWDIAASTKKICR